MSAPSPPEPPDRPVPPDRAPLKPPDRPAPEQPAGRDTLVASGRRRPRLAVWIVAPVALVMVVFIVILATRDPATDRITRSPLLGKPAPAITGKTLTGETYDLGDQQGRWVVVNFFASWCQPCVKEHPELRAFAIEHEASGDAEVVSVVFNDDADNVESFFEERGGDWPVVIDENTRTGMDYGVSAVPESYLVDPLGIVRVKITGGVTAEGLNRLLIEARNGT